MSNIIMDGRYLLALDALTRIGEYAGRDPEWIAVLWQELMEEPALMKEFMYYVDHHNFEDRFNCHGYCMTDLYVFQMSRYNLIRDSGKNGAGCNKESMVLGAFHDMACMIKEPEKYLRKLSEGPGMDRLN